MLEECCRKYFVGFFVEEILFKIASAINRIDFDLLFGDFVNRIAFVAE